MKYDSPVERIGKSPYLLLLATNNIIKDDPSFYLPGPEQNNQE